jgi:ketosteroid isomerase-like protein
MKTILFPLALLLAIVSLANAQVAKNATSSVNHLITLKQSNTKKMETQETTIEAQATQVVSEFLTAVQQGNHEKIGALLHPEVEWIQPGNNRVSGIKKSSAEVFQMAGKMSELAAKTLSLTEVKVLAVNGNSVACLVHWKAAQPVGTLLDVDNIDVYSVENGKIVQATVYSADIAQEDRFWGR